MLSVTHRRKSLSGLVTHGSVDCSKPTSALQVREVAEKLFSKLALECRTAEIEGELTLSWGHKIHGICHMGLPLLSPVRHLNFGDKVWDFAVQDCQNRPALSSLGFMLLPKVAKVIRVNHDLHATNCTDCRCRGSEEVQSRPLRLRRRLPLRPGTRPGGGGGLRPGGVACQQPSPLHPEPDLRHRGAPPPGCGRRGEGRGAGVGRPFGGCRH